MTTKAGWCLDGHHKGCRSVSCSCPCGPHPRALPAAPTLAGRSPLVDPPGSRRPR